MYAEEFILIPQNTYAPDGKTASLSQILHSPLINDKSSQLNYIQRFRERNISRDSPPPLNPTSPIPFFFICPRPAQCRTNRGGGGDVIHFAAAGPTLRRRMTLGPLQS